MRRNPCRFSSVLLYVMAATAGATACTPAERATVARDVKTGADRFCVDLFRAEDGGLVPVLSAPDAGAPPSDGGAR